MPARKLQTRGAVMSKRLVITLQLTDEQITQVQPIIDAIDAEFEKGKPSMSFGQICHYEGSFGGTIKFGLFKQAEAFAVLEAVEFLPDSNARKYNKKMLEQMGIKE